MQHKTIEQIAAERYPYSELGFYGPITQERMQDEIDIKRADFIAGASAQREADAEVMKEMFSVIAKTMTAIRPITEKWATDLFTECAKVHAAYHADKGEVGNG